MLEKRCRRREAKKKAGAYCYFAVSRAVASGGGAKLPWKKSGWHGGRESRVPAQKGGRRENVTGTSHGRGRRWLDWTGWLAGCGLWLVIHSIGRAPGTPYGSPVPSLPHPARAPAPGGWRAGRARAGSTAVNEARRRWGVVFLVRRPEWGEARGEGNSCVWFARDGVARLATARREFNAASASSGARYETTDAPARPPTATRLAEPTSSESGGTTRWDGRGARARAWVEPWRRWGWGRVRAGDAPLARQ